MSEKDYVEGQVIVVFKSKIAKEYAEKIAKGFGLALITYCEHMHIALLECAVGGEAGAIAELEKNELVKCVVLNSYIELEEPAKG